MEFQQIPEVCNLDEPQHEITETLIANLHPNEMTELNAEFISDIPPTLFRSLSRVLGNIPDSTFLITEAQLAEILSEFDHDQIAKVPQKLCRDDFQLSEIPSEVIYTLTSAQIANISPSAGLGLTSSLCFLEVRILTMVKKRYV